MTSKEKLISLLDRDQSPPHPLINHAAWFSYYYKKYRCHILDSQLMCFFKLNIQVEAVYPDPNLERRKNTNVLRVSDIARFQTN